GAHRLRRPDRPGRRTAPPPRVSSSQHDVNIAGARH
ncbi:GntR family transcriptional regulator, partial [Streptomyces sp. SID2119]|nr:GntR family transcriptional regulator [Streptomyces sp. SID2119]